jgi:Flp pilus assembly protein TadG
VLTARQRRDGPDPSAAARRGRGRWRQQDAGAATLELVIAFPVLLLLIFSLVQACLYFYARSLALAAAQEGVRTARADTAQVSAGVARARSFLEATAGDSLLAPSVSAAGSSATQVRIRVSGRSLSVLPGVTGLAVAQQASGSKERFTAGGTP